MIEITRVYDAPRELVWKAWTEPERLAAWWGKRGWNALLDSIVLDVRPGGTFSVTTVFADTGERMTNDGVFGEVVEPERLTIGDMSVTFTDLGDGRTQMDFRAPLEGAEDFLTRATEGVKSAFGRLKDHLEN